MLPVIKNPMAKTGHIFNHKLALKKLRAFGFSGSLKTANGKAKVKVLWKEYGGYINYTEKPRKVRTGLLKRPVTQRELKSGKVKLPEKTYNFKFQKLTAKQRKLALRSKLFSKHQFTPSGIFIEKPANIKARNFKITFKDKHVELKGGSRREVITRLDAKELIKNPSKAVTEALKRGKGKRKPKSYSLLVNGFRSKHVSTSARSLQYYLREVLLPDWLSRNEDLDENDFADIFHIRQIF